MLLNTQALWHSAWIGVHATCASAALGAVAGLTTATLCLVRRRKLRPAVTALGILILASDFAVLDYEISNFELALDPGALALMLEAAQQRYKAHHGRFASSANELGVRVEASPVIQQRGFLIDSSGSISFAEAALKIGSETLLLGSQGKPTALDETYCEGASGYCIILIDYAFNATWRFDNTGYQRIAAPSAWLARLLQVLAMAFVPLALPRRAPK